MKHWRIRDFICRVIRHRWHYGPDFRICVTCERVEYP